MSVVLDDVAFVYHNGRSYTLTEVNLPTVDAMLQNVKDTQQHRVDNFIASTQRKLVNEAFRLSNSEVQEIVRIADKNSVAVPSNRHALPLVVIGNELCPVRSVIYSPNRISATVEGWRSRIRHNTSDFWSMVSATLGYDLFEAVGEHTADHRLIITGKCKKAVVNLYTISQGRILTTRIGAHTLGEVQHAAGSTVYWYKCCTGNTSAENYWAQSMVAFTTAINSINPDSLAGDRVILGTGTNDAHYLADLVLNQMTDIEVKHVRPAEGWEVPRA